MQTPALAILDHHKSQQLWEEIIEQCNQDNLRKPFTLKASLHLLFLCFLLLLAYYMAWTMTTPWLVIWVPWISLCLSQLAFLGHNAGHQAISKHRHINKFFGQIGMTILCGLAFEEWKRRHWDHHRFVQQDNIDPDMIIGFVASVTAESKAKKGIWAQRMGRWQHIYVWVLSLFFGHSQRLQSQWGAFRSIKSYPLDCLCLLAHYGLFIIMPLVHGVAIEVVTLVYLLPVTFLGPHLAAVFWINHIGKPLVTKDAKLHQFEQQVIASRTIQNPKTLDWFFGGLNFQIEHHICPSVPSHRLRAMQKFVKPKIERNSLPYDFPHWQEAITAVHRHFRNIARS